MGTQSSTNPRKHPRWLAVLGLLAAAHAQTAVIPLLSPTALAFDASGAIYVAETGRHVVDRFDPTTGKFSVVAGTGIQGFSGDGGPATAAELDSPQGLALDPAGNLYIADTHNQRIRKVAASTGVITTIAGTGIPGNAGDAGPATTARLSLPSAVALDAAGNLFIADTGNHRIRRQAASAGTIATVAGNGTEGDAGDGAAATAASLDSPGGLAVDAAGNLYIADTHNHRVRMVAATTGIITTLASGIGLPKGISVDASGNIFVADTQGNRLLKLSGGAVTALAGTGNEGFAGDGGPAAAALLDAPRSAGVSPAGLITLADTRNQRVRQVDAAGVIRTLAGIGTPTGSLLLSGPAVVQYGTGSLTAALAGATGTVAFYEVSAGSPTALGTAALSNGAASFSTAGLSVGSHRLLAAYGGDSGHASAESAVVTLTISPAPVLASAGTVTTIYGQAIPILTGTLIGVLPRDIISAVFATEATSLSPVGSYPITATLTGAAAGNYTVSTTGSITIAQASSTTTLASSSQTAVTGTPVTLSARATSNTRGTPTGKISFLDSGVTIGAVAADQSGAAAIPVTLDAGTHTLTAIYPGDANFLPSTSVPLSEIITPVTTLTPDFALNVTTGAQTAIGGSAATFAFAVAVTNGSLSGPILLSASGLPAGATASFNPAVIPPGGAVNTFTLTIQTVKPAAAIAPIQATAILLGAWLLFARRRKRRLPAAIFALTLLTGCGDRVASLGSGSAPKPTTYPITVTGTSTAATGAVLQHTAVVTLTVQ
jgi:sugar lactone lactonase YvrE